MGFKTIQFRAVECYIAAEGVPVFGISSTQNQLRSGFEFDAIVGFNRFRNQVADDAAELDTRKLRQFGHRTEIDGECCFAFFAVLNLIAQLICTVNISNCGFEVACCQLRNFGCYPNVDGVACVVQLECGAGGKLDTHHCTAAGFRCQYIIRQRDIHSVISNIKCERGTVNNFAQCKCIVGECVGDSLHIVLIGIADVREAASGYRNIDAKCNRHHGLWKRHGNRPGGRTLYRATVSGVKQAQYLIGKVAKSQGVSQTGGINSIERGTSQGLLTHRIDLAFKVVDERFIVGKFPNNVAIVANFSTEADGKVELLPVPGLIQE